MGAMEIEFLGFGNKENDRKECNICLRKKLFGQSSFHYLIYHTSQTLEVLKWDK